MPRIAKKYQKLSTSSSSAHTNSLLRGGVSNRLHSQEGSSSFVLKASARSQLSPIMNIQATPTKGEHLYSSKASGKVAQYQNKLAHNMSQEAAVRHEVNHLISYLPTKGGLEFDTNVN